MSSTPNLEELLNDIDKLEQVVGQWGEDKRLTVIALLMSVDTLHKEAFGRLIEAVGNEPGGDALLQKVSRDPVVFAVLRHFKLIGPSLAERVDMALETVRPALASHGGGVQLVAVEPPAIVTIALTGACSGCPASAMTLSEGVEKAIREHCPEVTEIKKIVGSKPAESVPVDITSPFSPAK